MSYPFGKTSQIVPASLISAASWYAYSQVGPVMDGSAIVWSAAIAGGVCVISGITAISEACSFIAEGFKEVAARTPKGNKGTAKFASWKHIKKDILYRGFGPYWGAYAGKGRHRNKVIMANHTAPAAIFGTTGSGKDARHVIPNIMSIPHSKYISDFKSVLPEMIKAPLEELDQDVVILDIGGLGRGKYTDGYNLLQIHIDDFMTPGGLMDIESDTNELAVRLYPEPDGGSKEDPFWREGTHEILEVCIIQAILVHGTNANLGHVNLLIGNRIHLLKEMEWVCGQLEDKNGDLLPAMSIDTSPWVSLHNKDEVDSFITQHRNRAADLVDLLKSQDKGNMALSFLKGAKNALKHFSPSSRAFKATSHSTFRFSDMKTGKKPLNVIVSMDFSRLGQQGKINTILQWAATTEWKRCKDHFHVPVHLIGNEIGNAKIVGLASLLTWAREVNIVLSLYVQSPDAFRKAYDSETYGTLISESEIKIFLPHQRSPEVIDLIEKLIGESSIITKSHNGNRDKFGLHGYSYQEEAKPLLSRQEIMETDKAILFIRNNPPVLVDLPPYPAIDICQNIGINKFYGKPWKMPIQLRIGNRKGNIFVRLSHWIKNRGAA